MSDQVMEIHSTLKIMVILILGYWRISKAKQNVWLADNFLIHISRNGICNFCFYSSPSKILLSAFLVNQTQSTHGSERHQVFMVCGTFAHLLNMFILSTALLYLKQQNKLPADNMHQGTNESAEWMPISWIQICSGLRLFS